MSTNTRSILPDFDVFTAPGVQVPPGAMTEAAAGTQGLGKSRLFALSPVVAAMKGLGDDAVLPAAPGVDTKVTGSDLVWTVALLSLAGALCYQAGKAIAPSKQDATTWGWIAVPTGLFTGVVGLGVMGFLANRRRS
jgi:hypothetical protein